MAERLTARPREVAVAVRLGRIVFGTDFSAASLNGLRWVAERFAPGAELVLVHAVEPAEHAPYLPPPERGAREEAERVACAEASARLHEVAATLPAPLVRCEVVADRAVQGVARVAEDVGADLVAVGPHGEHPRPWKMLGSTAERLIRVSPVPVLVAAAVRDAAPRSVLVAVDASEMTPWVIEWSAAVMSSLSAAATVLHVAPGSDAVRAAAERTSRPAAEVAAEIHRKAREWVAAVAEQVGPQDRVTARVEHGAPDDSILAVARAVDADLIVIGRRRAGRALPAVLGSTASAVLRGAPCPVLVVAEPPEEMLDVPA